MQMTTRTTVAVVLGLGVGLGATRAGAYPIAPRTIWELTAQSSVIVVARVAAVETGGAPTIGEQLTSASFAGERATTARLEVREVLKGRPEKVLHVPFSPGMICPAPPKYVVDATVLAFLSADEEGILYTTALSYGTLYPDEEDLPVYRERILEAVALQAAGEVSAADERSWRVRAASRRATRWDGLYGLMPAADVVHAYYDPKRSKPRAALGAVELRQIVEGFAAEPSADSSLATVLRLAGDEPSPALDRAALAAFERALRREWRPWWAPTAMALLLRRFGAEDLAPYVPGAKGRELPEDLALRGMTKADLIDAWQKARAELKIPEVEPIPERAALVPGVGSNTPD